MTKIHAFWYVINTLSVCKSPGPVKFASSRIQTLNQTRLRPKWIDCVFPSNFNLDKNKVGMYENQLILFKYFYMLNKDNLTKRISKQLPLGKYVDENLSV